MEFLKSYEDYLKSPVAPQKTQEPDLYGVNYYTKDQTLSIIERIKVDKPKEFEILLAWLEKAVTEYNGFFFLGI